MSKPKMHIWGDYFYSRINGNYSKTHKNILNLVDERLKKMRPDEYPNIIFRWSDISDLYKDCKQEYFGLMNDELKQIYNDYKFFTDDIGVTTLSYPNQAFDPMVCELDFHSIYPVIDTSIKLELIHWNKDKDCVYVKLADGRSTVVKRYGDTKDDIYAAVAYAIAKIEFKTNSNFKKEVDSHLKIKETKKNG
nr:MAG TPA: hypothetical protein [Caudoviricetes sp.]